MATPEIQPVPARNPEILPPVPVATETPEIQIVPAEYKKLPKKKMRRQDRIVLWVSRVIIWFVLAVVLFPILWVIQASVTPGDAFYSNTLLPHTFSLENYKAVFQTTDFLLWMRNSMLVCTSVAILQVLLTATAAYAFSRMRFFGRKNGLITLLILQMFPNMMSIAAIYGVMAKLNLLDNLWPLVLVLTGGSAYNVWLLKGFMDTIPQALDEAAIVDGANSIQVFWRIVMPLSAPMIAVMFLFSFIGIYSEYVLSSAALHDPSNFTVALGLQQKIPSVARGDERVASPPRPSLYG